MILTCIKCGTSYAIADNALGKEGRTVRCKNCGHSWLQTSVAPAPGEEILPPPPSPEPAFVPLPADISPLAQAKKRALFPPGFNLPAVVVIQAAPRWMKVTSAILLIAILILSPLANRRSLLQSHPEFAFLVEPLGIYYTDRLAIADVSAKQTSPDENSPRIEIGCNIINESKGSRTVPEVIYTILGADGNVIARTGDMAQTGKNMIGGSSYPCQKFTFDSDAGKADRVIIDLGSPLDMSLRKP